MGKRKKKRKQKKARNPDALMMILHCKAKTIDDSVPRGGSKNEQKEYLEEYEEEKDFKDND